MESLCITSIFHIITYINIAWYGIVVSLATIFCEKHNSFLRVLSSVYVAIDYNEPICNLVWITIVTTSNYALSLKEKKGLISFCILRNTGSPSQTMPYLCKKVGKVLAINLALRLCAA